MGFLMAPKSVTLNDSERRNGRYFAEIGSFGANFAKLVEAKPILLFR